MDQVNLMKKESIVITGITGFLGSHLAEYLSSTYFVIGIVRSSSNPWRVNEIANDNIILIDGENSDLTIELEKYQPFCIVHCAWSGVSAAEREDWVAQAQNIVFTTRLLETSKALKIKKFIALGSQAEYGHFSGRVDETHPCKPYAAYGAAKLATLKMVEAFCSQNNMLWYWLRIFPMYGTREAINWFIPSVIKNAIECTGMDLTAGEQLYGYLHAKDFSRAVQKVVESKSGSGTYNLASNAARSLRSVIESIVQITGTRGEFRFGALPYRKNQVMHMEGDSQKFFKTFDFYPSINFELGLTDIIEYYRNKLSVNE